MTHFNKGMHANQMQGTEINVALGSASLKSHNKSHTLIASLIPCYIIFPSEQWILLSPKYTNPPFAEFGLMSAPRP